MSLITHVFTTKVPNKHHGQVQVSLENCRIDCVNIVIKENIEEGSWTEVASLDNYSLATLHFTLPELKKIYDLANAFNETNKKVKEIL